MSKIHAALEIGTSRTLLAVGETQSGGRMKIISHAEIPSSGVRKSQIIDISQATQSIRSVLREIESRRDQSGANVEINTALLVGSGQHIHVAHSEGNAVIESGKVDEAEMMEAARRSREMPLPKGRELLDIIDQDYQIDSLGGISSPKGMSGRMLKLNTLQIHASSDRIQDARTAAENAKLEISEPVFAATCTADAVLEEHERRNGALVLDLGGGSTGYAAYCDGILATAGVIGVGGDHVTNDIAYAFQTTNAQAEQLKTDEASACIGQYATDNSRVRLTGSSALMESRAISRRALDTVVNARLKEIFTMIRETMEDNDLIHRLHAGVVIAGGGAGMREIEALVEQELGLGVRRGRPLHVDGLEGVPDPWSYATISGALLYSQRTGDDAGFLNSILGRFFK